MNRRKASKNAGKSTEKKNSRPSIIVGNAESYHQGPAFRWVGFGGFDYRLPLRSVGEP